METNLPGIPRLVGMIGRGTLHHPSRLPLIKLMIMPENSKSRAENYPPNGLSALNLPSSVRRRAKSAVKFTRYPCKYSRGLLQFALVPVEAAARTPASEQKLLASIYQVPYEHEKVRASLLPVLVSAHKVPGNLREHLCRFSRGLYQVCASGCASRREDACKRAKAVSKHLSSAVRA